MKYIRTKDEIFEVTSKAGHIYCAENQNNEFVLVNGRVVEKEADTIEELCDEFVAENRTGYRWLAYITTKTYEDSEGNIVEYKAYGNKYSEVCPYNLIDDIKHERVKIYGAIWTDKGLIYKAKMKGVLPNGEIDWELL